MRFGAAERLPLFYFARGVSGQVLDAVEEDRVVVLRGSVGSAAGTLVKVKGAYSAGTITGTEAEIEN